MAAGSRVDDEVDLVGRNVDARQLVDDLVHLGEHDAVGKGRRLDNRGRLLGIGGEEQVALAIGLRGGDQRDPRRQVDVVARVEFVVGVDGADRELLRLDQVGDGAALRAGVAEVDLLDHALLEELDMGRQRDAGHHEMDVAQVLLFQRGELVSEEVRLLLVVAFEAEDVARLDDAPEDLGHLVGAHELAAGQLAHALDPLGLVLAAQCRFCSDHVAFFVYPLLTVNAIERSNVDV